MQLPEWKSSKENRPLFKTPRWAVLLPSAYMFKWSWSFLESSVWKSLNTIPPKVENFFFFLKYKKFISITHVYTQVNPWSSLGNPVTIAQLKGSSSLLGEPNTAKLEV